MTRIVVIFKDSTEKPQYWNTYKNSTFEILWPAVSYGCKSWTLQSTDEDRIQEAQLSLTNRAMLVCKAV